MKKTKFVPCIVTSREGMEATVADVVRLKLEQAKKTAAMEIEIAAVQKKHQEALLETARLIQAAEAGVFVYCKQHRKELFSDKKSIDMLLATVGFRDEPPSVEKTNKKVTWEEVALRLQALDWGAPYITEASPDVNKSSPQSN
jgi:phage host-nuclease inhibitor protein Gam